MLKKKIEQILEGLQYTHIQEGKSKLEIMQANKKRYEFVTKNASKLIKDDIDLEITNSIILRWIKGRNWEGGLGSGKDIDKLYSSLADKYNTDFDDIYNRANNLMKFWEDVFKKNLNI